MPLLARVAWWLPAVVASALWTGACSAQAFGGNAAAAAPATAEAVLLQMAAESGVIFSGRVLLVDREDAAGYVDVRFRIERGVRGCAGKNIYVLREWAGLWTGQPERYHVGQRRLMLLRARGPSGMSAPVNGMDGAIPLLALDQPPVMDANGKVPADLAQPPAEAGVDLRWLAVRAQRTASPARIRAEGEAEWAGPVGPLSSGILALPGQQASVPTLSTILDLLAGSTEGVHAR